MATRPVNDIELYYEIHGSGTPLVLVAGLASDSQSWLPVLEGLARHCRLILPDNRGAGRTCPQTAHVTVPKIADDCAALIRALGLPRVHLLGHSMGGFVARELAVRHPELVDRLILAGTAISSPKRNRALFSDWAMDLESAADLARWFRNIFYWIFSRNFFENEAALNEAVRFALEYPYPQSARAFRNQVDAIAQYAPSGELSAIRSKTLILSGQEDLLFPVAESEDLAAAIPGASLKIIRRAAHSIHMEQPGAFTDAVLDFLKE